MLSVLVWARVLVLVVPLFLIAMLQSVCAHVLNTEVWNEGSAADRLGSRWVRTERYLLLFRQGNDTRRLIRDLKGSYSPHCSEHPFLCYHSRK